MALATVSVGTGLYNLLYNSYNVRDVKSFGKSLDALTLALGKNYFQDSATLFTYGLLPLNTLFALMGISGVGAVQNVLALLAIGNLPSATGFMFPKRGDYFYYLANDLLQIIDPNNAPTAEAIGLDLTPIGPANSLDRLAVLGSCLLTLRKSNPVNFSTIAVSEPVTQFLDNIALFDRVRNAAQATVPAIIAPSPVIGVNTVAAPGIINNFKSKGFGTATGP